MQAFRIVVLLSWLVIVVLTVHAVSALGLVAVGDIFFGDFSHPWRAQINGDFSVHVLLLAAWIAYREKHPAARVLCALGALTMGSFFSLGYIFVATFRSGGDFETLLLGRPARAVG